MRNDSAKGVLIRGIDSEKIEEIDFFKKNIIDGELSRFVDGTIILGKHLAIELGDFMGLLEREVVVTGHEIENTAENLLDCIKPDNSLITLYWGDSIDESLATRCMELLVEKYPNTDFELVYGGQPYYEFIISIE